MADINFASMFSHVRRPLYCNDVILAIIMLRDISLAGKIHFWVRGISLITECFLWARVESDKFHVISPCMGCTCPFYENNISVPAKMSGLSTIKGDVLTILSDAFCFCNWTFIQMQHRC